MTRDEPIVNARRLLILLVPWVSGGCFLFRSAAPVIAPIASPAFTFDSNVMGKDAGGLAAAAERLCSTLTTRQQKVLGFALAQKGHELLGACDKPQFFKALANIVVGEH